MKFFTLLYFAFVTSFLINNQALTKQNFESFSKNSTQIAKLYSKHWFGKAPFLKNNRNPLLIHDIFILSFDLEKKFPSWIAYHLSPASMWGYLKEERKYVLDPFLSPTQSLNFRDYKGASNCDGKKTGYNKGHLAPLGSFKASAQAYQAQYLSNIVPQTTNLNQGPWRKLEEKVRSFVKKGNEVRVLAGPIYGKEGNKVPPCWKAAQGKLQEIPKAYWKIISFKHKSKINTCAFMMPQNIENRNDKIERYKVNLKSIQKETGLSFFKNIKRPVLQNCKFLF